MEDKVEKVEENIHLVQRRIIDGRVELDSLK